MSDAIARVLRTYFQTARQERGLTQGALADLTSESSAPVNRQFVKRMEAGAIPEIAQKVFTWADACGASLDVVRDLVTIRIQWPRSTPKTLDSLREAIIEAEASGDFPRANGLAFSALGRGEEGAISPAALRLFASILLRAQCRHHAALHFATEAIEGCEGDSLMQARALIQVAQCQTLLLRPALALATLSLVDDLDFDDAATRALRWLIAAKAEHLAERHEAMDDAANTAFDFAHESGDKNTLARTLIYRALCSALLGRTSESQTRLKAARVSLTENTRLRHFFHLTSGRIAEVQGEADRADREFRTAEDIGRKVRSPDLILEPLLGRVRVAHAAGDEKSADRLLTLAVVQSRKARDPESLRELASLSRNKRQNP